jgi:hypothetical protein
MESQKPASRDTKRRHPSAAAWNRRDVTARRLPVVVVEDGLDKGPKVEDGSDKGVEDGLNTVGAWGRR